MGCNGANKHQLIHFHGQDDEPVQRHAQQQAHAGADEGQKLDLAEDVAVHFFVIEAQNLDGGKLLFSLGKVDADQVVQHHRRQRRRASWRTAGSRCSQPLPDRTGSPSMGCFP